MPSIAPYNPFVVTNLKIPGENVEEVIRALRQELANPKGTATLEIRAMVRWLGSLQLSGDEELNNVEQQLESTGQWWKTVLFYSEVRNYCPSLFDAHWNGV
jgi:hypothetical protein